jgi:hypothetical protein
MAVRKAKIKQQLAGAMSPLLQPEEQVRAETFAQSGPSPWLTGVFGLLIMLLAGTRPYFIVVTNRRVLFMKASMLTTRPKGLAWADPIGTGQVRDATMGNALWSKFKYSRPEHKDIRFNVHRLWRDDGQAVVAALSARPEPPMPPPPTQPPTPTQS